MIIKFRVLAVSKETGHYDTDLMRGLFECDHQILDTLDTMQVNNVIHILQQYDWKPTKDKAIQSATHILVPFIKYMK